MRIPIDSVAELTERQAFTGAATAAAQTDSDMECCDALARQLKVTEIFYSLQGETNTSGIPTVFIRLTGCPLRCTYCDTAYAFHGGNKLSIAEIGQRLAHYATRYVTVTGGEPLAQPNSLKLLKVLVASDYTVSLETSGALDISAVDPRVIKVMDLKTPSSGESEKNRYENIAFLTPQDQVKFVIADERDYRWAKDALINYRLAEKCQILFSPESGASLRPETLAEHILADQLPVRFQIQLHKLLWRDARGK